jgi:hypothetical protein
MPVTKRFKTDSFKSIETKAYGSNSVYGITPEDSGGLRRENASEALRRTSEAWYREKSRICVRQAHRIKKNGTPREASGACKAEGEAARVHNSSSTRERKKETTSEESHPWTQYSFGRSPEASWNDKFARSYT